MQQLNYKYLEKTVEEFQEEKKKFFEIHDELNVHVNNILEVLQQKKYRSLTQKDINDIMINVMNELYDRLMNDRLVDEDDIMNYHTKHQIELKEKNILWR